MLKQLNKAISTPIAIGIILILAVLAGGLTLWQYSEMEKQEFGGGEIKFPERKEWATTSEEIEREVVPEKQKLLLRSGENIILFNIKTNQTESNQTLNTTGLTINCWAGCNSSVQISQNGKIIIFYVGEDLERAEPESPYLISKLYISPDKLLFETDETKQRFGQWILTPDGKEIYVAIPREDKSTMDLYQTSLSSGETEKVVEDIGKLQSPLRLSRDQSNLLSLFRKERIEDDFHYYDIYATEIDLESKLVHKELVAKDDGDSFPFFSVESLVVSPDLSKIVSLDQDRVGSTRHFWIRMINLRTDEDKKIFQVSGFSNADFVWSSDSNSLLFALYPHEIYKPPQQGIWLYDLRTQKTRILIEKPGYSGVWGRPVRPIKGSFDGQRFLYQTEDGELHLFNILNNMDQILPFISDSPIYLAQWVE